ncbi:SpoIIE family protein phosphatase [Spirochaetota bacterium]
MSLYYEWGTKQLLKKDEELCGDSVVISRRSDSVTLALSDGLGSGVKANILATLTTRIAMHMLENELHLDEVVETLSDTLPRCNVRKLAYSTFAIAQFFTQGTARLVEFDSPLAFFLRNRKLNKINFEEKLFKDKKLYVALINLQKGDWIIFVSDGVINAGIGGVYPLGWGWDNTGEFLEKHTHPSMSADDVAEKVAETVNSLYAGPPGDDVSIVAIKVRSQYNLTILTGPPADKHMDEEVINRFMQNKGRLAVCGGTTGKIAARCLGKSLDVELDSMTKDVPPSGKIEGIDIATEGILTLTKVNAMLRKGATKKSIELQSDGASNLLRHMLEVDKIRFLIGTAINPAHQNPELPGQLGIRTTVVNEIADKLTARGKAVSIEMI